MDGAVVVEGAFAHPACGGRAAPGRSPSRRPTRAPGTAPRSASPRATGLPCRVRLRVDADHRPVRRRSTARHRGLDDDPFCANQALLCFEPVQVTSRRGQRHPVGAGDRGPGHGPTPGGAAPRDGAPDISEEIEGYVVDWAPTAALRRSSTSWWAASARTGRSIIRDYVETSRREVDSVDELAEPDSTESAPELPYRERARPAGRGRARRGCSVLAVTGCCPRFPACRAPSSTALSRTSAGPTSSRGRHRGPHDRRRRGRAACTGRPGGLVAARRSSILERYV